MLKKIQLVARQFLSDHRAAPDARVPAAVAYELLVALISLVILAIVTSLGSGLQGVIHDAVNGFA
jgi:Flp pilus assembly pilin Flp